ncbi:hypothetical protein BU24DRAFT_417610 [Aaosphaeria arxii CBS 175.79]|uniref:EF-hand n=1 Tax=Aaosphaeria arxii CBS 175.79 TaxID=1450172 RepID=A0A6A5YBG9_9PLEO|nr:uncharacterized protein BU24DRAFT_417610 [Aaosphaeria arxii CBS 175.79]KAF2021964.1 hypothetical protein BU24DRAFT_417610 [Aaosphaeria arxii CBS 175.79]
MPTTNPIALSRYRPAILVVTGAAAAYTAYLLYSSVLAQDSSTTDTSLHRSNAIRRPPQRPRSAHIVSQIEQIEDEGQPLGAIDFFGAQIELNTRHLCTPDELRLLASEIHPEASREQVEYQIEQLYDVCLDRILGIVFHNGPLTTADTDAVSDALLNIVPNDRLVTQALERYSSNGGAGNRTNISAMDPSGLGDRESLPATELEWQSDGLSDDELDDHEQTLQRTLYHIAEDRARQEGVIHRGITCNGCDTKPIRGIRWHCANCNDFDLCSDCKATNSHIKTHIFYEVRIPLPNLGLPKQDAMYPGRPHLMSLSVTSALKKRLVEQTGKDYEEIEALWDTFTCLASVEWEEDPNKIGWAIDRRGFNQAFIPRYSSFMSAPNLVYDRIFAYYDSDRNGRIGFEEFVLGLAGLHSRDTTIKSRIVFNGYDMDGDGYISRKDVLRIFRAFYAIEREATRNYLSENAEELSLSGGFDTIHSSQPLGSAFTRNGIPDPRPQQRQNKVPDDEVGSGPILGEDMDDTEDREEIIRLTAPGTNVGRRTNAREDEAVSERWLRRRFYIDEEEGFHRPSGVGESDPLGDEDEAAEPTASPTPDPGRTLGSRSSSRVRFQDDVDFEIRSNASTSSRPVGERWGGFEIPKPEKDLGKDILYQITQQGFNELLNSMFQEKEDNALDAVATRPKRRTLVTQIDQVTKEFHEEDVLNKAMYYLGVFRYSKFILMRLTEDQDSIGPLIEDLISLDLYQDEVEEHLSEIILDLEEAVVEFFNKLPGTYKKEATPWDLWKAKLLRMQLHREIVDAFIELAIGQGWLSSTPSSSAASVCAEVHDHSYQTEPLPYRDPTMPQFRPNSLEDLPTTQAPMSGSSDCDDSVTSSMLDVTRDEFNEVTYIHYSHRRGPFFIIAAPGFENGSSSGESTPPGQPVSLRTAQDGSEFIQVHSSTGEDTLMDAEAFHNREQPPPPDEPTNTEEGTPLDAQFADEPCIFLLSIAPDNSGLDIDIRAASHCMPWEQENTQKPLENKIRVEALNEDSPLHLTLLASMQTVEDEINERKGMGLLSYEEFEYVLTECGSMRFLEAWLDWVSF